MKSVYIHIPFCSRICTYCDFTKMFYNSNWVTNYLIALKHEIELNYKNDIIKTIYIGGGTPSCLSINELKELLGILNIFKLDNDIEFTFECNIESIDEDKLELLYQNKVNRLSIGIQTFNDKGLVLLNRKHTKEEVIEKINIAKRIGFSNINIDLIYALPNETKEELENDINMFLMLDIPHISTYSLIIEPNTILYKNKVNNIDDNMDCEMYELITNKLEKNGYIHYETSNFSKIGYQSKHNLIYWNNEEYYGFGLGSSGYINNYRYTNTKSLTKYLNNDYLSSNHYVGIKEQIENEFILGLRKISGINKNCFNKKYKLNINEIDNVKKLISEGKLIDDGINIYINSKYIYLANDILINFIGE